MAVIAAIVCITLTVNLIQGQRLLVFVVFRQGTGMIAGEESRTCIHIYMSMVTCHVSPPFTWITLINIISDKRNILTL